MSKMSTEIRKSFKKFDDVRDAGLKTPESVERFDDILYGTEPKWQKLDVYRPKNMAGKKLPVIISIHGGGWVYGDKERYQYYCMSLCEHGFAVVNYTYRLAPEFKFPASFEDAKLVFEWVKANAKEYGLDDKHIFGVGDSAGAQQLALICAAITNPKFAKEFPVEFPKGFKFTGVALNCGPYNMAIREDESTMGLMKEYLPNKGTDEELRLISPINFITDKFTPSFVMTSTGDFLGVQASLFVNKLVEKKVPHVFHYYGTSKNLLGHVFHCDMRLGEAKMCNKDECDFFKSLMVKIPKAKLPD